MNWPRIVLSAVLALLGIVWIGQGLGYIGGSFMTSDRKWAIIGGLVLVVALAVAASGRRGER